MAKTQYNADNITVLEGLETVRKRPGTYIGGIGQKALNHLIYEIMDNAIDEYLAGYHSETHTVLEKDGSCTVRNNGRGIPVEMHRKGVSAERAVMTILHAGGKFDNSAYKASGGLYGVGSSVMNAFPKKMRVCIGRGGVVYEDSYSRGGLTTALENGFLPIVGKQAESGTEINFLPDLKIPKKTHSCADWLKSRLHETAYLNPGTTIYYENKLPGEAEQEVPHEPERLIAYVRALNEGQIVVHEPIYIKGRFEDTELECAIQFVDAFEEKLLGLCNSIYTAEGGTHLRGFKTRFTQLISTYVRELGFLKEKGVNFTGADTRSGMIATIAIKHPDPVFEGQTKTKLTSVDATKTASTTAGNELTRYFDRDLETVRVIITCAERSAKIRRAEEKARTNLLTKPRFSFDSNGKLTNCESRDPVRREIFIVEGNSAGGSVEAARNRMCQTVPPVRGRILNVEKAPVDKIPANVEIKTMINSFGCGSLEGYGNDFDIMELRCDKIILTTDADVDGSHINTLFLTFLYRFMPELIYDGHVYIAMLPFYRAVPTCGKGKDGIYIYDDKAPEKFKTKHKEGSFILQRYKGLGEINPEQLWETTLNLRQRILKRVEIEDARLASEVTALLVGSNVGPRRDFIHNHAGETEIDAQR